MHPIQRITSGRLEHASDVLAIEEPLEIRVRGRAITVTLRTPGADDELAAGLLLTEGIVRKPSDILAIEPCGRDHGGNVVNVVLSPEIQVDFARLARHLMASSSCGLCGKTTIESVHAQFAPIASGAQVRLSILESLPAALRAAQPMFDRTGGLHAAGVFDLTGNLLCAREDVGRHNAVDKVIGRTLLDGKHPLNEHILLVSGRASFEIMQKALAARISVIAAISAPSSLAVDFAATSGQCLVGFLRADRMNIYAGASQILI